MRPWPLVHRAPRSCRENRRVSAALTNAGMAEISVKQLKFRGLGIEQRLDVADKLLPGTEASASVNVTVPKNAAFSVPSSEHLYDGRLFRRTACGGS